MNITQQQYNVLMQSTRYLHCRIFVLNDKDAQIAKIEGITVDGNISMSADSSCRRSGKLSMVITDKSLLPDEDSKIWLNKRIQIDLGLMDYKGYIQWFKMGRYAIKEGGITYSKSDKKIDVDLGDYMLFLDGTLSGRLSNQVSISTTVTKGVKINDALQPILTTIGKTSIENIQINGSDAEIPVDINRNPNDTVYDLVKEILDFYMGYEFFVDENGRYIIQKIKDTKYDPIEWDFSEDRMNFSLNYSTKFSFSNISNAVYVWGRKLNNGIQVKWVYRNRWSRNNIAERNLLADKQAGDICLVKDINKSYMWDGSTWNELDFNVVEKFNIERVGREIAWAYNDEKCFTDIQARLRCEYELFQRSNFAEKISFNCIPVYKLEPNKLIKISIPELKIDGIYRIVDIDFGLKHDAESTISAVRVYY